MQSLKLFEILKCYFRNENGARLLVEKIETVIDNKFNVEKEKFAPASAIDKLDYKIELHRQKTKMDFAELESEVKTEFSKKFYLVSRN